MNRADYTLSSPATSLGAIAMLAAGIVIALLVHWLFFWFEQRVVRRTRREADDAILAALYQPARWLIEFNGFGVALAPIRFGPKPRDSAAGSCVGKECIRKCRVMLSP